MRVTSHTFPDSLIQQLTRLTVKQNRLQTQAATGQRIQSPEDDPAAVRRVLDLQAQGAATAQYQRNISTLQEIAQTGYTALRGLTKISDRAAEIAVLADGTKSRTELAIYATEIDTLIQQAVGSANATFREGHLFGGNRADQPPFRISYDSDGRITAVDYQGSSNTNEYEIGPNVMISPQAVGANTSGAGPRGVVTDLRTGADLFNHLIALRDHLQAGDIAAIAATDRAAFAADEDNLLHHIGNVGAVLDRLTTADASAQQRGESIERSISSEVDADLAQTLVQLSETQTAYQAALQSGAKVLGQSLLDYLR
jgi:flagellar hook-associated protein 3 FlgL